MKQSTINPIIFFILLNIFSCDWGNPKSEHMELWCFDMCYACGDECPSLRIDSLSCINCLKSNYIGKEIFVYPDTMIFNAVKKIDPPPLTSCICYYYKFSGYFVKDNTMKLDSVKVFYRKEVCDVEESE